MPLLHRLIAARLSLAFAAAAVLVFLGPWAAAKDGPGPFLQEYLEAREGPEPARELDIEGEWRGLLMCPSGAYPVALEMDEDAGVVTGVASIEHAVGDPRKPTPFHLTHKDREGEGVYEPFRQAVTFIAKPDPDQPPNQARGLTFEMLLSPTREDHALLAATETRPGARGRMRDCKHGVAVRDDAADDLEEFLERVAVMQADRRPVVQTDCPPAYRDWLASAVKDADAAFAAPAFEDVFGAAYPDMGAEDILQASAVISGSCIDRTDRRQSILQLRAAGWLRDARAYQNAGYERLRDRTAADWAAWAEGEIARGAPFDQLAAGRLRGTPTRFDLHKHPALAGFDALVAPMVAAGGVEAKELEMVRRLDAARDDFRALIDIHLAARGRGDVDMEVIGKGLDAYLPEAAKAFASAAKDVRDAVYMAAWNGTHAEDGACPAGRDRTCRDVIEVFEDRVDDMADDFADRENAAFDAIRDQDDGLQKLEQAVAFERQLRQTYRLVANAKPFRRGAERRADFRTDLQQDYRRDIVKTIEAEPTATGLRALEARYFLDDDLEGRRMSSVRDAFEARLVGTRPFVDLTGGAYFNALYNKDFTELRRLDREYMAGVQPLMAFGAQQAIAMGPLLDALAGRRSGQSAGEVYRALENLTAFYAVLGTYLIEYQDAYAECLAPNAATVVVSTRTDRVRKDRFGNVVERHEGWTTEDAYKVNPKFAGHFNTLFNSATGTGQARLLDLFLNDGKVSSLRTGVRRLMDEFDCDSDEVQQLEAGFLAYDQEITRRVRRR